MAGKKWEFSNLSKRSALSRDTSAIRLQQNKAIALDSTLTSYRQSNIVFTRNDAQPSARALFHMITFCNWLHSCAQNPPKASCRDCTMSSFPSAAQCKSKAVGTTQMKGLEGSIFFVWREFETGLLL